MDKAIIALCGIGKMFVGDVIEMGECLEGSKRPKAACAKHSFSCMAIKECTREMSM